MEKNIEHLLNTTRPELTPPERVHMWEAISSTLTPAPGNLIPSPFYRIVHAHRGAFALALIVVMLMSGSATVVTAEAARPGDALFPLDQAIERVRIRFAKNDDDRVRLANTFTEERLGELRSIVGERRTTASSTDDSSDDERVGEAVDALMRVMDDSNMSDTAREKIYGHLFTEIDDLSIDVRVDEDSDDADDNQKRVSVRRDKSGSKIEIRKEGLRTRIERKDGQVRIERKHDDDEEDDEETVDDDFGPTRDASDDFDDDRLKVRGVSFEINSNDDTVREDEVSDDSGRENDSHDDEDNTGNTDLEETNDNSDDDVDGSEDEEEFDDSNTREVTPKLEARAEEGRVEVHAEFGEKRDEFETPYTSRASLISFLAERYNLPSSVIEAVLDLEVKE